MQPGPSLAIIGAGSMGGAILRGLLASGVAPSSLAVTTSTESSADRWRAEAVTALSTASDPDANRRIAATARTILLAVKPALVQATVTGFAPALPPDTLLISVAAGVRCGTIEALVPGPVVRAMPNTPALVRRAVTGIAAGRRASVADLLRAREIFEAVGTVVQVPESQLDALSAVSGSGPATVAFLIERLTQSAIRMGFDAEDARAMVEQTLIGTALLLDATGESPAQLRRAVTSPNGTTERIIAVLERADLSAVFDEAMAAAVTRAQELATN